MAEESKGFHRAHLGAGSDEGKQRSPLISPGQWLYIVVFAPDPADLKRHGKGLGRPVPSPHLCLRITTLTKI